MAIEQRSKIWAVAAVDNGGGGAGTSRFTFQRGFSAVAHTAAGVYTLTMDIQKGEIDAAESVIIVTGRRATEAFLTVTRTSDAVFVVRSWTDAGGAQDDVPFDVAVFARGA